MSFMISININSLLMILIPPNNFNVIYFLSPLILTYLFLIIIYNKKKSKEMRKKLESCTNNMILKYRIKMIMYVIISIIILCGSVYFSKNYELMMW